MDYDLFDLEIDCVLLSAEINCKLIDGGWDPSFSPEDALDLLKRISDLAASP